MLAKIRRLIVTRLAWLTRTHYYVQPAAGYTGWIEAPLFGTVAFVGATADDLTVAW